jgi:hypothetical protein
MMPHPYAQQQRFVADDHPLHNVVRALSLAADEARRNRPVALDAERLVEAIDATLGQLVRGHKRQVLQAIQARATRSRSGSARATTPTTRPS